MPREPIPPAPARVARAAFPQGNRDLRLADERETLVTADTFRALFPTHGQPALPPWRLARVTLLPGAEGLSDRQAVEAVRSRIAWNHVLRLELTEAGFDASVLREVRGRRIAGAAASLRFETLLTWCRTRPLLKARGRQRTDAPQGLAAGRALNRREVVGATRRHALPRLAVVAPAWLRAVSPPEGRDRDTRRAEDDRLPTTQPARAALALTIGHDGWRLLSAVDHAAAPPWLREVPAVAILRRVWIQHDGWDGTPLQWREAAHVPPAAPFISSPEAPEAQYARKPTTQWVGYPVHLTATCDEDRPHRITPVETVIGPAAAGAAPPKIHEALPQRDRRPGTPIVDPGCLDADLLGESREHDGVARLGPTRLDEPWQAREGGGFDAQPFHVDGAQPRAPWAAGKAGISGPPAIDHRKHAVIKAQCSSQACRRGDPLARCIRSHKRDPRRTRTIRPQPPSQALQAARQREATEAFQTEYARRAGIEGTISREPRSLRLRRTRYIGLRRGHLGHILAAVGLNVWRLGEGFLETARAKTRLTPFARRMAHTPAA